MEQLVLPIAGVWDGFNSFLRYARLQHIDAEMLFTTF